MAFDVQVQGFRLLIDHVERSGVHSSQLLRSDAWHYALPWIPISLRTSLHLISLHSILLIDIQDTMCFFKGIYIPNLALKCLKQAAHGHHPHNCSSFPSCSSTFCPIYLGCSCWMPASGGRCCWRVRGAGCWAAGGLMGLWQVQLPL